MAPPNTASPGEVKSTAPMPSPTLPVEAPFLVKRADHALTTPYVFPPECTLEYEMKSKTRRLAGQFGDVKETILYVDIDANEHWQTCQPTGSTVGYLAGGGAAPSVYRGAVCPSGWRAFDVGIASQGAGFIGVQTWSTAKCCQNEDALVDNDWGVNYGTRMMAEAKHFAKVCVSTNTGEITVSQTDWPSYSIKYWTTWEVDEVASAYPTVTENGSTTTLYAPVSYITTTAAFSSGRAFYPPLSLEWVEEDNQTLSPKWPTLTSDMLIPTWNPGQYPSNDWLDESNMKAGVYDNKGAGRREEAKQPPSMPNKVAIPVIAVLASLLAISLGALLFLLWRGRKDKTQGAGSRKIMDHNRVGLPMDGVAESTAHLNGQAGDDMELRERDAAR